MDFVIEAHVAKDDDNFVAIAMALKADGPREYRASPENTRRSEAPTFAEALLARDRLIIELCAAVQARGDAVIDSKTFDLTQ